MPDYQIDVGVVPDADRFPEQLAAAVGKAEARQDPVEVELSPKVPKGFARDAQREVKAALSRLDAEVTIAPALAKTFRRDVQKLAQAATKGQAVEVPVTAALSKSFRRDLQRQVKEATTGVEPEVTVQGKVGRGFRAQVQRSINEALTERPLTASVNLEVDRRGYADFVRDVSRRVAEATTVAQSNGAADVRLGVDSAAFSAAVLADVGAATTAASGTEAASVEVRADTKAAQGEIAALSSGLGSLARLAAKGIVVGGVAGVATLAASFGVAVKSASDFEEQLSDLTAVATLNTQELSKLRDQALQAGADTVFSASEAATAQTELAKAGASVQQILAGGLPAALSLASAGGIELGEAATFVAQGLNTFQLGGEEAARVADTLAAAANKSAADIPSIGLGLAQAGLVADSFGITLEETSGILALFSQNGLQGSDAGTSFKTMLQRLNPTTDDAAGAMRELGLDFFDASGQFVGIEDVAGQLQERLGGLSEEQRNTALQTIFGADAVRAANLLYKEGAPGIQEWTGAVTDQGFAADVAATKLDNLKGDLEALKGSFETAFIEAGAGQTAPLRELVQSLVPLVNTLGPQLAALLPPVTDLLQDLVPALSPFLDALLPALVDFADLLAPIARGLSTIGTAALEGLSPLLESLEPVAEVAEEVIDGLAPLLPLVGDIAAKMVDALLPALAVFADPQITGAVVDLVGLLGEGLLLAVEGLADQLVVLLPDLVEMGVELASELVPALVDLVPLALEFADALGDTLLQALKLAMPFLELLSLTLGVVAGFLADHPALVRAVGIVYGVFLVGKLAATVKALALVKAEAITTTTLASGAAGKVGQAIGGLQNGISSFARSALSQLGQVAGPAGLGLLLLGVTNIVTGFQDAKREANELGDRLGAATASGGLAEAEGLVKAAQARLDTARENAAEFNNRDFLGRLGGSVEAFALSAKGAKSLLDDAALLDSDLEDQIDRANLALTTTGDVAEALGLSKDKAYAFVEALGVDPAELGYQGLIDALGDTELKLVDVAGAADDVNAALKRALGEESSVLEAKTEVARQLAAVKDAITPPDLDTPQASVLTFGVFDPTKPEAQELVKNITGARDALVDYATAQAEAGVGADSIREDLGGLALGLVDQLLPAFDGNKQAVYDFLEQAGLTPGALDRITVGLEPVTAALRDQLSVTTAQVLASGNFASAQELARQALELNGDTLAKNSEEGRQNRAVLDAVAEATRNAAVEAQGQATTQGEALIATAGYRDQLTLIAAQFGLTSEQATAYANEVLGIPDEANTKANLDTKGASDSATALEHQLDGIDGRVVTAELVLGIQLRNKAQNDLNEIKDRQFEKFAVGGIVTSPTLALIGEAGDEVVLPLTDKARMVELLTQAGVLGDLAGAAAPGVPASGATGSTGADPAAVGVAVETTGLEDYRVAVAEILTGIGADFLALTDETVRLLADWSVARVPAATLPGLSAWQFAVLDLTASTTAGMAATLQAGFDTATVLASAGGTSIVAALVTALSGGTAKIVTVATGYASSLGSSLNPILRAVGKPDLKLARGGEVPGPRVNRDVVPAMLMPGEVVIRKASVDAFGVGNLLALNSGMMPPGWTMPRYAEGGEVTGDTVGLNPEFGRRLGLWSAAVGAPYNVGSGFRSIQEQTRLYQAYLAGVPGQAQAAPPGRSMHNFGLASDGNRWRDRGPEQFGLRFPMSYEPWHVEPVEARQWAAGVQPDGSMAGAAGFLAGLTPLPQVPAMPYEGAVATAGEAVMRFVYDRALAWAGSQSFGAPGSLTLAGDGSAGQAAATAWLLSAIGLTGVPSSWLSGLLTIARRESNFDPLAVNGWDSNAAKGDPSKGLMQVIGSTFRAFALPGHGNIFDPVDNAVAAIRYILERYGDIGRVQQANPNAAPRGYADGGLITKDGLYHLAEQNRPELVLPLTKPDRVRQLAQENALERILYGDSGGAASRGPTIEGDVILQVTPPGADDPENYGMALSHRIVPALSAALARL